MAYWFTSRLNAVWHWMYGHKVLWRVSPDDLCPGDITCETCNLIIWCRALDPWQREVF